MGYEMLGTCSQLRALQTPKISASFWVDGIMAGDKLPRVQSNEMIELRQARHLVAPYPARAAQWNGRLTRLRVVASSGRDDPSAEPGTVVPMIAAARVELQQAAALQPETTRSHSLVRDMDKALHRLLLAFESLGGTTNPQP